MVDFAQKSTLYGELVELRPASGCDALSLHTLMVDPEVGRLTGSVHADGEPAEHTGTVDQLEELYDRWSVAHDRIVWVIIDRKTGEVVGEAVLNDLDVGNRSCGFRIWISGARDRGLGTEATRLVIGHALDEQGLNRVELEVYAFNPRARHVYEKVGFVHEGTRREALRFNDAWVAAHVMSIIASDWQMHSLGLSSESTATGRVDR
jgi:RimJ/RimL family protein N-acetyltransferase